MMTISLSPHVSKFLAECRTVNENEDATSVPPLKDEISVLIAYLRAHKCKPVIIGSIAVLSHLPKDFQFRPTSDVDIWVRRLPKELPPGWRVDTTSIGVVSWISPAGGVVDFILPNQMMSGNVRAPKFVDQTSGADDSAFPMASVNSLIKLKLNSVREKDMSDCITLIKASGSVPSREELGRLNHVQAENFEMIQQWFEMRPMDLKSK